MAIDNKLRGCDLVRLKVVDVFVASQMKERTSALQSKTQKPVGFEITDSTRKSILRWLDDPLMVGSEFLWSNFAKISISAEDGKAVVGFLQ